MSRKTPIHKACEYKFDLLFLPVQQTHVETPIGEYGNIMSFATEVTKVVPMRTLDLLHLSYDRLSRKPTT